MQRLRTIHDTHYDNIHKLADTKRKYEAKQAEEVQRWKSWALYPLAGLANAYYEKNLQHLNLLLSLEGKFMDRCIDHITIVNAVCEGKLSEAVIMKDMMSAAGDGNVKSQDEVNNMFWPEDAEHTRALCKSLYEEVRRLEAQYQDLKTKMSKRESVEVRRKKVQDWLMKGLVHKDTIKVDPFHHHPLDPKAQHQFNILCLDQRGEEGKFMKKFLDMQVTHRGRMQVPAINYVNDWMIASILKSYALDERTEPILRIYVYRLIFPRIPEAMAALITQEEREKSRALIGKIAWLRTLSPHQLGIEEENVPPDFVHDPHYLPLAAPPGTTPEVASPRPLPEEKKEAAPTTDTPTSPSVQRVSSPSVPPPPPPSSAPSPASHHPEMFAPVGGRGDEDFAASRKMVPDNFPYADAINTLSLLSYEVVPFDMFFRVVSAVRLVHTYHKQYTRANREARARAQARALTYDDPFTNFMTKLVDESNRKAEELERKDEEDKAKAKELREAEAKRLAEAANHHRHSPSMGALPASPLANLPTSVDPPLPPLDGADPTPGALPHPTGGSPSANGTTDHHPPGPAPTTMHTPGGVTTPQKAAFDHPLAPHHLAPPTPPEPTPLTGPAPVPSIPTPAPIIPERPQEETPLNADQLTPLCVWIVIHANVPSLPARLGQIQRFVREDWRQFGEAGYSFCQVETAAYYVEQLTEETLGNGMKVGEGEGPPPPMMGEVAEVAAADRVSSPAVQQESPSGNLLSPGRGPTHSASLDGLKRRTGKEEEDVDVFADLIMRQNEGEQQALPDLGPPPKE